MFQSRYHFPKAISISPQMIPFLSRTSIIKHTTPTRLEDLIILVSIRLITFPHSASSSRSDLSNLTPQTTGRPRGMPSRNLICSYHPAITESKRKRNPLPCLPRYTGFQNPKTHLKSEGNIHVHVQPPECERSIRHNGDMQGLTHFLTSRDSSQTGKSEVVTERNRGLAEP